jgi:hypothetical protein
MPQELCVKRYIIAAIIGAAIGALLLAWLSLFPNYSGWHIPFWDEPSSHINSVIQPIRLEQEAVALRVCHYFMEYGYWFLVIPGCAAFVLAWTTKPGNVSRLASTISQNKWGRLLGVIGLGLLVAFVFTAPTDIQAIFVALFMLFWFWQWCRIKGVR